MSGFGTVLPIGGEIDSIGEVRKLPYPLFPSKTVIKTKGTYIDVAPVAGTYSKIITCDKDVEFVSIALAQTGYLFPDYWEFSVGDYKLMETIYTKEVPQTITGGSLMFVVYPIPAGVPMRIDFVNRSATSKQVVFDLKFLVASSDAPRLLVNES
jgi:hypothetical protein